MAKVCEENWVKDRGARGKTPKAVRNGLNSSKFKV
jgi:hypothetical protein